MTFKIEKPGVYQCRSDRFRAHVLGQGPNGNWYGALEHVKTQCYPSAQWDYDGKSDTAGHDIIGPWTEPRKPVEGWCFAGMPEGWSTAFLFSSTRAARDFDCDREPVFVREVPRDQWPKE